MRDLLKQIELSLHANLYYLSLVAVLCLPDMCAALGSLDGRTTGQRYAKWFDDNVAPKYGDRLSGETCYQFRCSLLHEGTTQHPTSKYTRIIFLEPGSSGHTFHNNLIDDALNLDVRIFCFDVMGAAAAWINANEDTATYKNNSARFIQRYPAGLAPYIVGTPVIG